MSDLTTPINRRRALTLGSGIAGGLIAASSPLIRSTARVVAAPAYDKGDSGAGFSQATIQQLEEIFTTDATVSNGLVSFELSRDDLQGYTLGGSMLTTPVPYAPSWQNNGTFFFQALSRRQSKTGATTALMNGDFGGLLPKEINPFIDVLLTNGITVQAYHMHFPDIHPNELYFIHMRAVGDPVQIARKLIAAVKVTSTPLPQPSATKTTSLPVTQLTSILGGSAEVGSSGVVTINVPRKDTITLAGIPVNPYLNIATSVAFLPLKGRTTAAVAPDFGMTSSEIQKVFKVMRQQGWVNGCLYNQETEESPQLYFSHQVKVGDPVTLAKEVRTGLDQMNTVRP